MALQKNLKLTDNFGIEVELPDCYIRVVSLHGSKTNMTASVDIFKKPEGEFATELLANEKHDFLPRLDGPNFIVQAYNHLKTLPQYQGAVDC
jgi:hypothetical protein